MFPVIQIGPLSIQSAGLFILAGFYFALLVTGNAAKAAGLVSGKIENTILISAAAGLVGARLGFLVQNPDVFRNNLDGIFSPSGSLLDLSSGILFALLTAAILLQKYHLPVLKVLDATALGAAIQTVGVLLSRFASGGDLGTATGLSWGLQIAGQVRHPVQVYEILSIVILGVICRWSFRRKQESFPDGVTFFLTSAAIASILVIMQVFHESSNYIYKFRTDQLAYLVILVISLISAEVLFTRRVSKLKEETN